MAITRKRKHAHAEEPINHSQTAIKAFGNVSKAHHGQSDTKKRKAAHEVEITPRPVVEDTICVQVKSEHKRKRSVHSDGEDETTRKAPSRQRIFRQFARRDGPPTETSKHDRTRDDALPSPAETPSKRAVAMLDRLHLDKTAPIPFPLKQSAPIYQTPPQTPDAEEELPAELMELVELYTAFVSALSLYHAHNGAATSAEMHILLPMIAKTWKKRAVELEDVRRILALAPDTSSLEYCGQAGVRLVMTQSRGRRPTRIANVIDVDALNAQFTATLRRTWLAYVAPGPSVSQRVQDFLTQLPLLEVKKNEAAQAAASTKARGQRRLAVLKANKADALVVAQKQQSTVQVEAPKKTAQAVQSRGTSLLDRVLARQALTTSASEGPTQEQRERRAALHRIEEVARVLNLLAGAKLQASFSMQSITQHLQQSLRNPISRDEVERCLGLMSQEITPDFVSIMQSGTVRGVIVSRMGRISLEELRARVAGATGEPRSGVE